MCAHDEPNQQTGKDYAFASDRLVLIFIHFLFYSQLQLFYGQGFYFLLLVDSILENFAFDNL